MYCSGGHLGFPTGIKNRKFVEDLPMIIPGQFGSIGNPRWPPLQYID
jgi:hypothetical protein